MGPLTSDVCKEGIRRSTNSSFTCGRSPSRLSPQNGKRGGHLFGSRYFWKASISRTDSLMNPKASSTVGLVPLGWADWFRLWSRPWNVFICALVMTFASFAASATLWSAYSRKSSTVVRVHFRAVAMAASPPLPIDPLMKGVRNGGEGRDDRRAIQPRSDSLGRLGKKLLLHRWELRDRSQRGFNRRSSCLARLNSADHRPVRSFRLATSERTLLRNDSRATVQERT